ncbi:DUF1573 domain-containing protein [Mucilaginibacter boryungensis]|uniref:DUF1573 domain-containing protein n=1 Tax=Mucilaginibacter boryungensis TaxID=768480 RepID=A0ABR9XDM7_9SPHI|nr:DUF1573 domain-containing protein [Mucilaginibacter boryungensis]MBE9665496.1 DUF1573 domain-containing protein [Mucilaginibacter boryungensis]
MRAFLIALLSVLLTACNHSGKTTSAIYNTDASNVNTAKAAKMVFEQSSYNFGEIVQGQQISHKYKFTNTGLSPLVIKSVIASCGCTLPQYPHKPIPAGESEVINVVFNAASYTPGKVAQSILILANTIPIDVSLIITGEVKEATKTY